MCEDDFAIKRHRNSGVKFVTASGKRPKLVERPSAVLWLVEKPVAQRQGLIRADDVMSGLSRRNPKRLFACQQKRDLARRRNLRRLLNASLIDVGRDGLEGEAGIGQQRLPRSALRGQYQRV